MKNIPEFEEFLNENYAIRMQKEFEADSKYSYSDVLTAVRNIKDKQGWDAISNQHRLHDNVKKELPGIQHLWDIRIGPIRSSVSHGRFSELFVNEKPVGNIFVK